MKEAPVLLDVAVALVPNLHRKMVAFCERLLKLAVKAGQAVVGVITKLAVGLMLMVTAWEMESRQNAVVAASFTVNEPEVE